MADREDRMLICASVGDFEPSKGSVSRQCSRCGGLVVVAMAGQRLLRDNPRIPILCLPCAERKELPEARSIEICPGAMKEFIDHVVSKRARHERN